MSQFVRGAPKMDDENDMRTTHVKLSSSVIERRPALGELGNRVKNTAQGVVLKNDPKAAFKEVRARVDSHWKKEILVPKRVTRTDSLRTTAAAAPAVPTATARVDTHWKKDILVPKRVTRTDSLKSTTSSTAVPAVVTSRAAPRLVRAKTLQTAEPKEVVRIQIPANRVEVIPTYVDNIDINDAQNLILVSEYVNDIYLYMNHLEEKFPIRENYLSNQKEVTSKMRGVLMDWLNEVHMQFSMVQETFFMTVAIVDRYLQNIKDTTRQQLQLVGVTALFLAAKIEDMYPPDLQEYVYITDDTYSKKEILDMEQKILRSLEFHMGRPIPLQFLRRYAKAAHHITPNDSQYVMAKYFLELAVVDYSMAHIAPSKIAAVAIMLAMQVLPGQKHDTTTGVWNKTLEHYSGYNESTLQPLVRQLAKIVKNAPTSKLQAVHSKYKSTKQSQISIHPNLTETTILDTIANQH